MQTTGFAFITTTNGGGIHHIPNAAHFNTPMEDLAGKVLSSLGQDFQRQTILKGISTDRVTLSPAPLPTVITGFHPIHPPTAGWMRPTKDELPPPNRSFNGFEHHATVEHVKEENGGTTIKVGPGSCVNI